MSPQRLNVTMQTVAREAGVSRATVSRVMSGETFVDETARKKVLAAARKLGYVRNAAASQLARRGSELIALLLRDAINPAYAYLQDHLLREAHSRGLFVVTSSTGRIRSDDYEPAIGEVSLLERLIQLRPSGLIVSSGLVTASEIEPFAAQIPTIVVPRPEPNEALHVVGYDEIANSRMMAHEVIKAGHRSVAVGLVSRSESYTEHLRAQTMIDTLLEAGVKVTRMRGMGLLNDPAALFDRIVAGAQAHRFTAMMFSNDSRAVEFLVQARRAGVSVPAAISVTGLDGIGQGVELAGLATVRNPLETVAKTAIDKLTELIAGQRPSEPIRELFAGEVLAGPTLAPPARH